MNEHHYRFLRFCMVGTVGFVVDAGTTTLLTQMFGVGVTPARLLA